MDGSVSTSDANAVAKYWKQEFDALYDEVTSPTNVVGHRKHHWSTIMPTLIALSTLLLMSQLPGVSPVFLIVFGLIAYLHFLFPLLVGLWTPILAPLLQTPQLNVSKTSSANVSDHCKCHRE